MVSLSLTAARAEATGFASAIASADMPRLRHLSYMKTDASTASVNVMLNQGKITIYAHTRADFQGDVTGYYAPQLWAIVRAEGNLYMSSGRFISSRRTGLGVYEVTADRQIHICGAVASASTQNYYATALSDIPAKDYVTVKVYDSSGQPADAAFTVQVKC